jgi:hypothetical protein
VPWAPLLALAFCVVDFAGLARLFTPPPAGRSRPRWYLLGAWFRRHHERHPDSEVSLAFSAIRVWDRRSAAKRSIPPPLFVACWSGSCVLIIGALAVSGERLFGYDVRGAPACASSESNNLPCAPSSQAPVVPAPASGTRRACSDGGRRTTG